MQPITTVLFDLGETLWHIPQMPPVDQIRAETVRRITSLLDSWGYPQDENARFLGRDIRLAVEAAESGAFHGSRISPNYGQIVQDVAGSKGFSITLTQAHDLWETWNLGGPFFGRTLFDDAIATLDWLRENGYRLGIVTNRAFGGSHFREELAESGLAGLFDAVIASCDAGFLKPHPEIFRLALAALDASPEQAIHVGDSLVADVAGAQELGMTAIWRRGRLRENADGIRPDYTIDQLADLRRLDIIAQGHLPHD